MQLSPRQYQADPTGAAYVQDTRPLMAALGAQAATQIEGNRMMTETMQKGMQGIENFAARRQLAAARAQLGTLDTNAEDYGQKLAGLVLDNPLAFTNAKTAPIANMAFKQASDENKARLDRKYQLADMATKFKQEKDLITLRGQTEARYRAPSRSGSDPYAIGRRQALNNVYQQQMSEIKANLKVLTKELEDTPEAKEDIQADIDVLNNKAQQLNQEYLAQFSQVAQPEYQPVGQYGLPPEPTIDTTGLQAPFTPDSSVGDGSFAPGIDEQYPLPEENSIVSRNLTPQQNIDASLLGGYSTEQGVQPMTTAAMEPMPPVEIIPEGRAVSATSTPPQFLNQLSIDLPVGGLLPPEIPMIGEITPPLQDTAKNIAETKSMADAKAQEESQARLLNAKMVRAESAAYKNLPAPAQQKLIESNVDLDPGVIEASVELANASVEQDSAKRKYAIAKDAEDEDKIAAAEALLIEADQKVKAAELALPARRNAAIVNISESGNPLTWRRKRTEALQREREVKMREDQAKAAADAKAAAAGNKPKEDAASAFNKASLESMIALKNKEPLRIAEETNKQWTEAKSQIADAAGGQTKLNQVVFDVLQNPLAISSVLTPGAQRDVVVMQIKNQISKLIPPEVTRKNFPAKTLGFGPNAFDQKAERDGFQKVSWDDVLTALADEMLTKYTAAYSNVMNPPPPTAAPTAFKPSSGATGNTKP